jgi:type I restriction enzyme R subunit
VKNILRRDTIGYTWKYRINFDWQPLEALYGFGSHMEDYMNLRGKELYLCQHNLKAMVPVLVSTNGYGLLFDAGCGMVFKDNSEGDVLKITELVNIFDKEERESEVEKIIGKAAKADHIASRTISAINVKMNDDSVFYKKLSELIREAIEDYRQHRIDEAEYLNKVKDYENQFLTGKQLGIPEVLEHKPVATAYYNVLDVVAKEVFENLENHKDVEADLAVELEAEIKEVIYEDDALIVDWQTNTELENELKIKLDDFLFESQQRYDLSISFDKMDEIIEEVIKIAKNRYK